MDINSYILYISQQNYYFRFQSSLEVWTRRSMELQPHNLPQQHCTRSTPDKRPERFSILFSNSPRYSTFHAFRVFSVQMKIRFRIFSVCEQIRSSFCAFSDSFSQYIQTESFCVFSKYAQQISFEDLSHFVDFQTKFAVRIC